MTNQNTTRQRLIDAAIELIYTRSLAAAGVQQICTLAGVQKGSFYHFFPSKRDLALAAIDDAWRQLEREILAPAFAADVPPMQRIERFFDYSARYQQRQVERYGYVPGCPLGNLALEMSTQDEVIRRHIEALFREAEHYIEKTLEAAREDGSAPHLDPVATAREVFATMQGALLIAKTRNDPDQVRTLGRFSLAMGLT